MLFYYCVAKGRVLHADNMSLPEYRDLFPGFLEIRRTIEFGRGVYTRQRLAIGTELISADPVTHVLGSHERGLRCDYCLERHRNLQRCGVCKFVRYCSKTCQKSDWSQHKAECKGICRINPRVPTDTMRLLARLVMKRSTSLKESTKADALQDDAQWPLDLLESHSPGYSDELKTSLAEQVMGARLLLGEDKKDMFDAQIAFEIACKLMSNSYNILDAEMNSIGGAVYIEPALFNHSCEPNCIALFTGRRLHLRCIRDINEGEQLLVSYVDLLDTRERRRRQLYKCYQFSCQCARCGEQSAPEGTLDRALSSTLQRMSDAERKHYMSEGFLQLERAEQLKKTTDWTELLEMCKCYLEKWQEVLGEMNVVTVKMRECLLDSYIELEQWKDGLAVAVLLQPAYDMYHAKYSPLRGIHLFKTAKLMHQQASANLASSVGLLDQAVGILTVTHGHTHPLVGEARGLLADIQAELAHNIS